jgi:hypothetical protein
MSSGFAQEIRFMDNLKVMMEFPENFKSGKLEASPHFTFSGDWIAVRRRKDSGELTGFILLSKAELKEIGNAICSYE